MLPASCSTSLRRLQPRKVVRSFSGNASTVREDLRALLRETAQPVAVVTSFMDPTTSKATAHPSRFHGATLSSFSSISMDPHPLVAFSLRIPSRMATSLTSAHSSTSLYSHMVINILSERQAHTAMRFSRADLYPEPFVSLPHSLTEEGLPVLDGAVGAMSCRLVAASWPLHDLESLTGEGKDGAPEWKGEGVASELFIAQVIRVEHAPDSGNGVRPLLYHRRGESIAAGKIQVDQFIVFKRQGEYLEDALDAKSQLHVQVALWMKAGSITERAINSMPYICLLPRRGL